MRWFWIDRFVEFRSGETARAIKNVSLAEEQLHDHFPGYPVMPGSLIIEGMAQTCGILLAEKLNFESLIVMAKVPKVMFHGFAHPGDTLTYDAKLLDAREDGGIVECQARIGERPLAEAEYVFACLPNSQSKSVCQENFLKTMQLLGMGDQKAPSASSG